MASTLALILSYIESLVPLSFAVPGIKMGLANIAIVFVLYRLGEKEAIAVSLIRLFWVAVLFGSFMTFLYSLAGAALSMTVMIILKRSGNFSAVGVSVAGGITHNAGQIIAAVLLMETAQIAYYLPVLVVSGTVTGVIIGIVSALLINKIPKNLV
ncbi:MAG TPA: Gx transporter family protein [Candidatus Faeciplasma pullistercoris]|uniref:Gx transporter family protein n=1 Tax=Candidatus Faeciplasma pullistercoris TaxID=2840800 RepID=A0A9D1GTV5_9FIRM|nr:Gx transporter family protein [Candidatus Faeciplasma pullistercoris]